MGRWTLDTSPLFLAFDLASRLFSPYDLNPAGLNPLREILAECIDFGRLVQSPIRLFVTATNVRTGRGRVFRNAELTPDVLLASGCLPMMFQAPVALRAPVPRTQEAAALALALGSLLLGLVSWDAYLAVPQGISSSTFTLQALASALWPVLAGGLLAVLLGRWGDRPVRVPLQEAVVAIVGPARRTCLALSDMIERVDAMLRQWTAAGARPLGAGSAPGRGDAGGALN